MLRTVWDGRDGKLKHLGTRKNDPEIVRFAVTQSGEALQYASRNLQRDPEILKVAMAKDGLKVGFSLEERASVSNELLLNETGQVLSPSHRVNPASPFLTYTS